MLQQKLLKVLTNQWTIAAVLLALLTTAVADTRNRVPVQQAPSDGTARQLVSPQWLHTRLSNAELLVIDARSEQDYQAGHIPGAVSLPVDTLFDAAPNEHLIAPPGRLRDLFSSVGVKSKSQLVLYDDGRLMDASRIFWILEIYGHAVVKVLDGGLAAWRQSGLPLSLQAAAVSPGLFVPRFDNKRYVSKLDVFLALDNPRIKLVDARPLSHYQGLESMTSRSGYIPGAISIPWDDNLVEVDGIFRLKNLQELENLYLSAGINPKDLTITYCNRGKASALTYFTLRQLGYPVAAYDGSWVEWSADPTLPVSNSAP